MKTLSYLAKAGRKTTSDEFKVLFFVCNTLSLNKANEVEIDRVILSKLCGWWNEERPKYSLNKISKITASLAEKGLLKKRLIFNKETLERRVFYAIPTLEDEKVLQKSVASNSIKKQQIEINSIHSINRNESAEDVKKFLEIN